MCSLDFPIAPQEGSNRLTCFAKHPTVGMSGEGESHRLRERRAFYQEHGYLVVPDVIPVGEMDLLCLEMDEMVARLRRRHSLEAAWQGSFREGFDAEVDPSEFSCESIHAVQKHSA